MHEFKFRAWDKEENRMIPWDFFCDAGIKDLFNNDSLTVMQFTGLKDKHGKEIFENDIVKVWINTDLNAWEHQQLAQVVFKCGCFCLQNNNRSILLDDKCKKEPLNKFFECEAIGNIYENLDILGQAQN